MKNKNGPARRNTVDLRGPLKGPERQRMIAEAAYYISEKRGFKSDPAEDWYEAEKQLGLADAKPGRTGDLEEAGAVKSPAARAAGHSRAGRL